jgi:hypothetical protein
VAGRYSDVIRNMKQVAPATPSWLIQLLYYALPNFGNFDFKDPVAYGDPVAPSTLAWVTAYAVVYIGIVLCAGLLLFRRRDFV